MLLIPMAGLLVSCTNELEEEFAVEVSYQTAGDLDGYRERLARIDYFKIRLYKYGEVEVGDNGYPEVNLIPILDGEKLFKDDILRLDNLEPGLYILYGGAYQLNDNYSEEENNLYIAVKGKAKKMKTIEINGTEIEFIVIDGLSPTVIKLVLSDGQA